jgi:transposase
LAPREAKQRQYEALRAYFVEGRTSQEVARAFGYTPGSFRVLCHQFRRVPDPAFFATPKPGPRTQPHKSRARALIIALRKKNHSVYEISELLKEQGSALSPTAVREVLREEGFAPLPRRMDEERPDRLRPTIEAVADVRGFSLAPKRFETACGGLFLLLPDLVRLNVDKLAHTARLPGSRMIPAAHALRACLVLKLCSVERKSHIMALVSDPGLALFAGLNAIPKKSYLSEYSSRIIRTQTMKLLAAWNDQVAGDRLFDGASLNLDFHSVPFHGQDPIVERHYVSMRSRRQKSVLTFLAQDERGDAFCYANADIRKGEERDEIMQFVTFWKQTHDSLPGELVFDSQLTTYNNLVQLDDLGIRFLTLRRRAPKLLREIALMPKSAWRTIELDVPTRKYRTPRVYETTARLEGRVFRQLFIQDLGHDEPTILVTNDRRRPPATLITRYARRMLIENALSDAVRFFHMNALSSAVGLKVDFDMALLVVASGLYRLVARRMKGYADAQARTIFRDLLDMPATVEIAHDRVTVSLHRRAHLPIVLASGLANQSVKVPWWNGLPLTVTT